jgi:transcriptional regulator with XRE-family HTH domain
MNTQKSGVLGPYREFGVRLTSLRQAAGLAQQGDLAELIPTSQQTVSRWEAGLSRPRDKQIPRIAVVLETDADELLRLAGYSTAAPVAAFDEPFPIDALTPESFERFCRAFVEALYPEAEVHRAGSVGHRQDGIDIEARFEDGNAFTFQCKRVQEFGPQKVHTASVVGYMGQR